MEWLFCLVVTSAEFNAAQLEKPMPRPHKPLIFISIFNFYIIAIDNFALPLQRLYPIFFACKKFRIQVATQISLSK